MTSVGHGYREWGGDYRIPWGSCSVKGIVQLKKDDICRWYGIGTQHRGPGGSGSLGWGAWYGVEAPHSLGGAFAAEISIRILANLLASLYVASYVNPWI